MRKLIIASSLALAAAFAVPAVSHACPGSNNTEASGKKQSGKTVGKAPRKQPPPSKT